MTIKSLFISKSLEEVPKLVEFCIQHSIKLNAHSFLHFEPVSFKQPDDIDVVFFSSPRAVKYYLAFATIPKNTLITCAGKSTKLALESHGIMVSFVSNASGKITQSAKEFSIWTNGRKVLFPISTISNKSYSVFLKKEQFREIIVYKTTIGSKKINDSDCFVFTSPSNVKGYLSSNILTSNALVIAWGESTAKSLGTIPLIQLDESSEEELIKTLKKFN